MENEILQMVAKSGVWAVLFVFLLFYVLTDSRKREKKYQEIIAKLNAQMDSVFVVQKDVKYIREILPVGINKEKHAG